MNRSRIVLLSTLLLGFSLPSFAQPPSYPTLSQCVSEDSTIWKSAARKVNLGLPKRIGGVPFQAAREAGLKELSDYLADSYQGSANLTKKNTRGDLLLHCALDPRGFPDLARTPERDLARLKVVQLLLQVGADVNARNEQQETPLQLAVFGGQKEIIEALLKKGAVVNGPYRPGEHPVQLAVATGNTVAAGLMLDRGADINPGRDDIDVGYYPLDLAVMRADLEMTKFLLQRRSKDKTDPLSSIRNLLRPLVNRPLLDPIPEDRQADAQTRLEIAKVLLQAGASPKEVHTAAAANHTEIVKLLLKAGGDPNYTNLSLAYSRSQVPLQFAASHANLEVVKALLAHGASVSGPAKSTRRKAIHYAIRPIEQSSPGRPQQRLAVVKVLLKAGADPNLRAENDWTPLHEAVAAGNTEIVELLLQHGAKVDAPTHSGRTPLHLGSAPNGLAIGKLLVKHGAKVDAEDRHRQLQPHHYAAKRGDVELVAFLLESGARIDAGDGSYRLQAIHHAACAGQVEMVKYLLERGARIDAVNSQKKQPLHFAASYGWAHMVQFLLDRGADPDAKDSRGNTPLMWAKKRQRPECVELLEKLGPDED